MKTTTSGTSKIQNQLCKPHAVDTKLARAPSCQVVLRDGQWYAHWAIAWFLQSNVGCLAAKGDADQSLCTNTSEPVHAKLHTLFFSDEKQCVFSDSVVQGSQPIPVNS